MLLTFNSCFYSRSVVTAIRYHVEQSKLCPEQAVAMSCIAVAIDSFSVHLNAAKIEFAHCIDIASS